MKLVKMALALASIASALPSAAFEAPTLKTITLLHRNEMTEDALAFQNGYLFLGKSKMSDAEEWRVEIYDRSDKLVKVVGFPHSVRGIHNGPDGVYVVGVSQENGPRTHISRLSWDGSKATVKTWNVPVEYFAHKIVVGGNRIFLNEPGSQAIYQLELSSTSSGMKVKNVASGIEAAAFGVVANEKYLFVVEGRSYSLGDENVVRVRLSDGKVDRLFKDVPGRGVISIAYVDGANLLAVVEQHNNQVKLFDADTLELRSDIPVEGALSAVSFKGCLFTSVNEAKAVSLIKISKDQSFEKISTWDLSPFGDVLKRLSNLALDPELGSVYVRSALPCPTCALTQSVVVSATEPASFNQCVAQ
jgi:hypothetical protein